MSCLSLSCQGLRNSWTVRALGEFFCTQNPDLIFLMDTRLGVSGIDKLKHKHNLIGFCVPSVGFSGGLALLWSKDCCVDVQSFSKTILMQVLSYLVVKMFGRLINGDIDTIAGDFALKRCG